MSLFCLFRYLLSLVVCVWARLLVEAVSIGMNLATFADIEPEFAACGTAFGHVPEIDTTLAGHTFAHSAGVCQLLSGRKKRGSVKTHHLCVFRGFLWIWSMVVGHMVLCRG